MADEESSAASRTAGDGNKHEKTATSQPLMLRAAKDTSLLFRVGTGPKGRGLLASRRISPGTVIHEAPCIRVVKAEYDKFMKFTVLEHYLFNAEGGDKLLALGYGSLFNHSRHPNVDYRVDSTDLSIRYISGHKEIQEDDELCISYGGNLWFDDASEVEQGSSESEDEMSFLSRMEI
jgi:SET domain-containing protein